MNRPVICLLGGTGFVGYHLANQLSRAGYRVRIPSRRRERHRDVLVIPTVDVVQANIHDDRELRQLVAGCDIVINLVAILNQHRRGDFQRTHVELPRRLVAACTAAGVSRLMHMSALNADPAKGTSEYLRSKGEGEKIVLNAHSAKLAVSVFRPSVIFGPGDHFFNRFADLLRLAPMLPLACPQARFAPVYVEDLAQALVSTLDRSIATPQRYELCGPKDYTLLELVEYTNRVIGTGRSILPLSAGLSGLMAGILGMVPGKPLTRDNVLSMKLDAVCSDKDLLMPGCTTAVEAVVPLYLGRKDQRSLYDLYRAGTHGGSKHI